MNNHAQQATPAQREQSVGLIRQHPATQDLSNGQIENLIRETRSGSRDAQVLQGLRDFQGQHLPRSNPMNDFFNTLASNVHAHVQASMVPPMGFMPPPLMPMPGFQPMPMPMPVMPQMQPTAIPPMPQVIFPPVMQMPQTGFQQQMINNGQPSSFSHFSSSTSNFVSGSHNPAGGSQQYIYSNTSPHYVSPPDAPPRRLAQRAEMISTPTSSTTPSPQPLHEPDSAAKPRAQNERLQNAFMDQLQEPTYFSNPPGAPSGVADPRALQIVAPPTGMSAADRDEAMGFLIWEIRESLDAAEARDKYFELMSGRLNHEIESAHDELDLRTGLRPRLTGDEYRAFTRGVATCDDAEWEKLKKQFRMKQY